MDITQDIQALTTFRNNSGWNMAYQVKITTRAERDLADIYR